ncbi:hypothetical protein Q7279_07820 [Glaesserella parasuis]|nr:hypothetical protein [Glaesserella parasuis]
MNDIIKNLNAHCGCQSCTGQNCNPKCNCQNGEPCICQNCTCGDCDCK